jgi:NADH-quinone oxidoreductase subunit B
MKIQEKISGESIKTARWYQKGPDQAEIPVPMLGPDLIDPRKIDLIKSGEKA